MISIKKVVSCDCHESRIVDIEDLIASPSKAYAVPSGLWHPLVREIIHAQQEEQALRQKRHDEAQSSCDSIPDPEVSLNSCDFLLPYQSLDVTRMSFKSDIRILQATRYGFSMIDSVFLVNGDRVKATFMGRDSFSGYMGPRPHNDQHLYLPLTTRCAYGCAFCDVPRGNPTKISQTMMSDMISAMLKLAYEESMISHGRDLRENLKIGFVKCGDPLNTENIAELLEMTARRFPGETLRISTIFPKKILRFESAEAAIMNSVESHPDIPVRFQVSMNSTSDVERETWTKSGAPMQEISEFATRWRTRFKDSRPDCKVILNFTIAKDTQCEPTPQFVTLFPPDLVDIRIRPAEVIASKKFETLSEAETVGIQRRFESFGYKVILGVATQEERLHSLISGQATGTKPSRDQNSDDPSFSQEWHDAPSETNPEEVPFYSL